MFLTIMSIGILTNTMELSYFLRYRLNCDEGKNLDCPIPAPNSRDRPVRQAEEQKPSMLPGPRSRQLVPGIMAPAEHFCPEPPLQSFCHRIGWDLIRRMRPTLFDSKRLKPVVWFSLRNARKQRVQLSGLVSGRTAHPPPASSFRGNFEPPINRNAPHPVRCSRA